MGSTLEDESDVAAQILFPALGLLLRAIALMADSDSARNFPKKSVGQNTLCTWACLKIPKSYMGVSQNPKILQWVCFKIRKSHTWGCLKIPKSVP